MIIIIGTRTDSGDSVYFRDSEEEIEESLEGKRLCSGRESERARDSKRERQTDRQTEIKRER